MGKRGGRGSFSYSVTDIERRGKGRARKGGGFPTIAERGKHFDQSIGGRGEDSEKKEKAYISKEKGGKRKKKHHPQKGQEVGGRKKERRRKGHFPDGRKRKVHLRK